jgi:nucleoside-diphosphate-sugar epimerase
MANMPIAAESELEDRLSQPTPEAIDAMASLSGDVLLLGVAGKMGPSLARMARRALDACGKQSRVIGAARFSSGGEEWLRAQGVETIRCDLLNPDELARLPDAPNVIFMTGMKFGSTGNESLTWAMNSYLPGMVCQKFRNSKIVAFSTGNVYGLSPVSAGGSKESDPPQPVGEYAMSCLGRERIFEHFSRTLGLPLTILRLNYACDLRYGVLVDLARNVWDNQPVDLGMGYFNTIWQGDANALTLAAFRRAKSPPWVLNLTGPELLSVRLVCERLGRRWNKPVQFVGTEGDSALLSNSQRCLELLGKPRVSAEELIEWVAEWIERGGRQLGKPTHFESRDGKF